MAVRYSMGLVYDMLGRYDRAVKAFDHILKRDQSHLHVWYARGMALFRLGNYADAVQSFDRVLESKAMAGMKWIGSGTDLALFERDEVDTLLKQEPLKIDAWSETILNCRDCATPGSVCRALADPSVFSSPIREYHHLEAI